MDQSAAFNLPNFDPSTVWLAGAGPGDPGLLTLLAAKGLQDADVILYDALVNDVVLNLAKPGAHLEFVGKRAGKRCLKQYEITERLINHAGSGKRILRLKGGDPFVFARGGEEAIALAKAKINFRIIPGITAGIGGLAYAGIPPTHRDINNVVSFVTGHDSTGTLPGNIDWDGLAAASPVIVFYMALKTIPQIADNLLSAGKSTATPMAIISNASAASQQVLETTLGNCVQDIARARPPSPAIIVVGESVKIRTLLKDMQQAISIGSDEKTQPRAKPARFIEM